MANKKSKFWKNKSYLTFKKPKGYYQILENVISEAKRCMEEQGFDTLPSQGNYAGLKTAISKYHGGHVIFDERHSIKSIKPKRFSNFRELLGEEEINYVEGTSTKSNDYSPATPEQAKARMIRPNGYWQSLENTISEAKKIMKEHDLAKLVEGYLKD